MPALNFKADWADDVERGVKRTTIRKAGRVKEGDTLYLYTGQRTNSCRKLGESMCLAVTRFYITGNGDRVILGQSDLDDAQLERLARYDTAGQLGAEDFVNFFFATYGLPFDGELISWDMPTKGEK